MIILSLICGAVIGGIFTIAVLLRSIEGILLDILRTTRDMHINLEMIDHRTNCWGHMGMPKQKEETE